MSIQPILEIYTDGAASGNPGPGGFGAVMKFGHHRKEISQGYRMTTNNRMELLAVIVALESITKPNTKGHLYSDSKYVIDSITKGWLNKWITKNFVNVKNPDLWVRFYKINRQHQIQYHWVKGHASNVENNRCDELAVAASRGKGLQIDAFFEANRSGDQS